MSGNRNYQNGKIYRVVDNAYEMCYIGSTIEKLSSRMNSHKAKYKKYKELGEGSYITVYAIFDNVGIGNCKIELLELYPCTTKEELHAREGYHQRQENCVNKYIAGRTQQEWYHDNRERVQEQSRKWKEENYDRSRAYDKEYKEKNKEQIMQKEKEPYHCPCGCVVQKTEKARHEKSKKHQRLMPSY